ncbi:energy-coupling factor transporter transmembrane component T family protein [Paenibacillus marinisediminis]
MRMWTWLTRIDPITKGIWLLSTGLAVMLTMSLFGQLAWFLSVVLLALCGAGWSWRHWNMLGLWVLGFGVPLFVFQWLVLPGETAVWPNVTGGVLTEEAMVASAALTLRSMTLFASSILYATTTEPRDVVAALVGRLHVPERLAYAAAIALRFVPLLVGEAEEIRHAQRLRRKTPLRGLGGRLSAARQLLPAVAQSALRHVHGVSAAMEAKRFGTAGRRTVWRQLRIMPLGAGLAAASLLAAAASIWML